jgi:hypothetical protein
LKEMPLKEDWKYKNLVFIKLCVPFQCYILIEQLSVLCYDHLWVFLFITATYKEKKQKQA